MPSVLHRLKGGDRRSIGAANAAAAKARDSRRIFGTLVDGLHDEDPVVRMRSADALEKASVLHPDWLSAHKAALLAATLSDQPELLWHVAQMAPRLDWPPRQRARVIAWLTQSLKHESRIVQSSALTALAEMAAGDPALQNKARKLLAQAQTSRAASMRARARRLLLQFPVLDGKRKT